MSEHMPGPTSSRGVYGFIMHLTSHTAFICYIIWSIVPENWFHAVGITYLPQRYWAVAVPIFVLTAVTLFAFVIYPSLGLLMTPCIDSLTTIRDAHSINIKEQVLQSDVSAPEKYIHCICGNPKACMKTEYNLIEPIAFKSNAIPPVEDLDIAGVSDTLYL